MIYEAKLDENLCAAQIEVLHSKDLCAIHYAVTHALSLSLSHPRYATNSQIHHVFTSLSTFPRHVCAYLFHLELRSLNRLHYR